MIDLDFVLFSMQVIVVSSFACFVSFVFIGVLEQLKEKKDDGTNNIRSRRSRRAFCNDIRHKARRNNKREGGRT